MDFTEHESSNIHSTAYDPVEGRMHVRFHSGGSHSYPCTSHDYDEYLAAESKGKAFHQTFRSREGARPEKPWKSRTAKS